jgi:glucose-6-phosphate dehydrogenase assembly protein OpcA
VSAASTIDPAKILKDLSELWVSLAKEKDSEAGVLRACSMTLIAAVEETEDPGHIGETIAKLMREHPSRAIVVRIRDSKDQFLASQVLAQCWMPFGVRQQICCEQVEITASVASLQDVPAVVLPLTVADLPVFLWCRALSGLDALAGLAAAGIAGKVIIDGEKLAAFAQVSELAKRYRIADLAWTRLTRLRELIAQIFENKCYLAELPGLTRVRITYEGERPTVSAFYLAAWLERKEVIWERGERSAMALENADGQVHTAIRTVSGENLEVSVRGQVTHVVFPESSDYTLLREELSIPGRDEMYEAALPRAEKLAAEFAGK